MVTNNPLAQHQNGHEEMNELSNWFGEPSKDEFINQKIPIIREVRSLLAFWNDLATTISQVKTGYSLAKKWEDKNLENRYLEEGKPLIKKMIILEDEIRKLLPELKGISFLRNEEIATLPNWMLEILGITVRG